MHTNKGQPEYLDLSEESKIEQQRHAETLRLYETKQRARSIIVPTAVEDVKTELRKLGEPITLFGEDHADRRDRLKEVIADLQLSKDDASRLNVSDVLSNSRTVLIICCLLLRFCSSLGCSW
jgi:hypothetical protein